MYVKVHEKIARLVAQRYGLTEREERALVYNAARLDKIDMRRGPERDRHHGLSAYRRAIVLVSEARHYFLHGHRDSAVRPLGRALHLVHDSLIPSPSRSRRSHNALERQVSELVRKGYHLRVSLPELGLPHEEYARATGALREKVGRAVDAFRVLADAVELSWRFTHAVLGPETLPFTLSVEVGRIAVESRPVTQVLISLDRKLAEAAEVEAANGRNLALGFTLSLLLPKIACMLRLLTPAPLPLHLAISAVSITGLAIAAVYAFVLLPRYVSRVASTLRRIAGALKGGEAYRWAVERVSGLRSRLTQEEHEIAKYLPLLHEDGELRYLIHSRGEVNQTPWYNPPPGLIEKFRADKRAAQEATYLLERINSAERDPSFYIKYNFLKRAAPLLWLISLAIDLLFLSSSPSS